MSFLCSLNIMTVLWNYYELCLTFLGNSLFYGILMLFLCYSLNILMTVFCYSYAVRLSHWCHSYGVWKYFGILSLLITFYLFPKDIHITGWPVFDQFKNGNTYKILPWTPEVVSESAIKFLLGLKNLCDLKSEPCLSVYLIRIVLNNEFLQELSFAVFIHTLAWSSVFELWSGC